MSCSSMMIVPAVALRSPARHCASSRCPLPETPAMPTISPPWTSRSTPRSTSVPRSPMGVKPFNLEAHGARLERLRRQRLDLAADHHSRQVVARDAVGRPCADHAAVAQHRHAVADRHDFVQLVRDEDQTVAFAHHSPERHEQVVDLLGRQHGGRLVEDDEAGAAVERLEDLDALLLADRELPDVAADRPSGRRPCDSSRSRAETSSRSSRGSRDDFRPSATFSATVSVGTSMKCWWIMPMPARIASAGEWKTCGLPSI